MANYNRVILAGNLTRDPELSYTPSSTPICKFGMAINRVWTDRESNEKREDTCFVDCTVFGKHAETFNQYMSKGRPVLIEGRLNFSRWTSQDGQKRSKLDVVVERSQFLGGRPGDSGPPEAARSAPQAAGAEGPSEAPPPAPATTGGGGYDSGPPMDHDAPPPADVDGDIPF